MRGNLQSFGAKDNALYIVARALALGSLVVQREILLDVNIAYPRLADGVLLVVLYRQVWKIRPSPRLNMKEFSRCKIDSDLSLYVGCFSVQWCFRSLEPFHHSPNRDLILLAIMLQELLLAIRLLKSEA